MGLPVLIMVFGTISNGANILLIILSIEMILNILVAILFNFSACFTLPQSRNYRLRQVGFSLLSDWSDFSQVSLTALGLVQPALAIFVQN